MRNWINLVEARLTQIDKPVVNSLGRPIARTPEGVRNFWTWFGRSKTINRQGQPLVFYHGTKADFRAFDPDKSDSNTKGYVPRSAFVFTDCSDVAQSYAGQKTEDWEFATHAEREQYRKLLIDDDDFEAARVFFRQHAIQNVKTYPDSGFVMLVYLRIVRPLRVNARGENWREIRFQDDDDWSTNDLMNYAMQNGHDGLIVKNVRDRNEGSGGTAATVAVFSPTQIKSALGNRGSFDPAQPEIDEDA